MRLLFFYIYFLFIFIFKTKLTVFNKQKFNFELIYATENHKAPGEKMSVNT